MRFIVSLIFILASFEAFAGYKILFVGDSITEGYGPHLGYVNLLKKRLLEEGIDADIINYGLSGTSSSKIRKKLIRSLSQDRPDLVVISCGIVDALQEISIAKLYTNLLVMIQASLDWDAKVIVGMVDISCWHERGKYAKRFGQVYEKVARKYPIQTFPFLNDQTLGSAEYNMGDHVHPNAKGDQLICDYLFPEIIKAMQKPIPDTSINEALPEM